MKKFNCATNAENVASYFVDIEGDIFEQLEEAEICGAVAEVIVDGFYVGSADEMKRSALEKYNAAK